MAYAFNWNPEDKMSDTQIIDHIKGIVPDYTENRFHVGFASDDGGRHICVYVEKGHQDDKVWKAGFESMDFQGWRVMRVGVPVGYIETFLNAGERA